MEIRIRDTGAVVSEREFRSLHPGTSFPARLTVDIINEFGADVVLAAPAPEHGEHQTVVRDGVVQDELLNWVWKWTVLDWTQEQIDAHVESLRVSLLGSVNAECDRLINAMVASYPATEQLTFAKQEAEALAYTADPEAATPMIDAMCLQRGLARDELVARILAKAQAFAAYTGAVIGNRQRLEELIEGAEDAVALREIDITNGWPT